MFFKRSENSDSEQSDEKVKVLVVDDEADIVVPLQDQLERNGYEVLTAGNGVEGLSKAMEEKPDVILLDMTMPIMDGQQMLEALRKQPSGNWFSVIMLTGRGHTYDKARANACGIDDYIVKPFDLSELLEKIEVVVESRKAVAK